MAAALATSARPFDLVIYGATGFTGVFVARYLARTVKEGKGRLKWAVAGRSKDKLDGLVSDLREKGLPEPEAVLLADVADAKSLDAMASQGRLLLNCTGPYRFLGEPVVASCLRTGTDVIDLCGEPEFMDRCLLKFNKEAVEKKVLVVSACAFDSVPADLGVSWVASLFPPGYNVTSVESFLTIDTGGHGLHGHVTTFEAAVHGFGSQRELARIRRELRKQYSFKEDERPGPRLVSRTGPYYEPRVSRYCFRFPGSDASVVRSSQRQRALLLGHSSFPRYAAYFTVPSRFWAAMVALVGSVFQRLAQYECGRRLLLRFPGVFTLGAFSAQGPSQAELDDTSFSMTFFARGVPTGHSSPQRRQEEGTPLLSGPDKVIKTRVSGPEPGYVATPIIFVTLARALLEHRPQLAVQGGVLTPGAVFYPPGELVGRLKEAGIDFTVLEA